MSDLSAEQVEALAGGPLLQQEVINLGAQQTSAKSLQRTTGRLITALQNVRACLNFVSRGLGISKRLGHIACMDVP